MDGPLNPPSSSIFKIGSQEFAVPLDPPWVMGILNVTPDSFSDGGNYLDPDSAAARAMELIDQGARIVDVGGESTRPGALPVPAPQQIRRVIPAIERIRTRDQAVFISIDTTSARVARAAIDAGANIVNDTSALRDDSEMAGIVAGSGASLVLMHRRGTSPDMQSGGGPDYSDLIPEITEFLRERIEFAARVGIDHAKIAIDPGIGFGKKSADNFKILKELSGFSELGRPIVVGASRKRFIGDVLGITQPDQRMIGSITCALFSALKGASFIRAHDVSQTVQALKVLSAMK